MSDGLPQLLRQFARSCPHVRLEVSVGLTVDLGAMVRDRGVDLAVVASAASSGPKGGVPLRRVPLVWAAAEGWEHEAGTSLPLAYSPPPCVCGQIGMDALGEAGISWHKAFSSHSLHDLRAAVLSGLGVAMFTCDNLRPGMAPLGERDGLPALPAMEFALVYGEASPQGRNPAVRELGRLIEQASWAYQEMPARRTAARLGPG